MPGDVQKNPSTLLLDTGAFVALVDRSEQRHAECVAVLEQWPGTVITTEAVLTETLHLVGSSWEAQQICLEFFARRIRSHPILSSKS